MGAIRREMGAIIARLHRVDLGKGTDAAGLGGPSNYVRDLVEKLAFVKNELYANYTVGDVSREWYVHVSYAFNALTGVCAPM